MIIVFNIFLVICFQNILETKETELLAERGKEERTAATITEQMYVEAQVTEFYLLPTRNKEETVIMVCIAIYFYCLNKS